MFLIPQAACTCGNLWIISVPGRCPELQLKATKGNPNFLL